MFHVWIRFLRRHWGDKKSELFQHNFGSIVIPENLIVPRPQFLATELKGSRYDERISLKFCPLIPQGAPKTSVRHLFFSYSVGSGPILIMDKRTIKIFGFTFDADKAPGKHKLEAENWTKEQTLDFYGGFEVFERTPERTKFSTVASFSMP